MVSIYASAKLATAAYVTIDLVLSYTIYYANLFGIFVFHGADNRKLR